MKRTFKFCSGFPAHRFPFARKKSVNLKSAETKLKCVNVSGIPNLAFKKKNDHGTIFHKKHSEELN